MGGFDDPNFFSPDLSLAGDLRRAVARQRRRGSRPPWLGGYDTAKAFTITGPVLESRYQNPHGEIWLDHAGKRWTVTLAPTTRMGIRGLAAAQIAVGQTVTVEGYPNKSQDAEMRAERITVAGKTIELR